MATRAHAAQPTYPSSAPPVPETDAPPMTRQEEEEKALLSRVAAQEPAAFDALYARYAPRVRGYLAIRLQSPDLIDEVLQDVMLAMWQYAARVPIGVPLMAWLCGVARHKASTALTRVSASPVAQARQEHIDRDDPEAVLLRREHVRTLYRALATLPMGERTALQLLVFQGHSQPEIAALIGEPVSTVRTRVSRARQRLRARVGAASEWAR